MLALIAFFVLLNVPALCDPTPPKPFLTGFATMINKQKGASKSDLWLDCPNSHFKSMFEIEVGFGQPPWKQTIIATPDPKDPKKIRGFFVDNSNVCTGSDSLEGSEFPPCQDLLALPSSAKFEKTETLRNQTCNVWVYKEPHFGIMMKAYYAGEIPMRIVNAEPNAEPTDIVEIYNAKRTPPDPKVFTFTEGPKCWESPSLFPMQKLAKLF